MSKTVTLRLTEDVYDRFKALAKAENRSLSNTIETMALKKLEEDMLVDRIEMEEIVANEHLLGKLKEGSPEAKQMKGSFVE